LAVAQVNLSRDLTKGCRVVAFYYVLLFIKNDSTLTNEDSGAFLKPSISIFLEILKNFNNAVTKSLFVLRRE